MTIGPCLCGDPYCPSCGNPARAVLEEAEAAAIEQLAKVCTTPEDYRIAVEFGVAAVKLAAKSADDAIRQLAEAEASYEDFQPPIERTPCNP